MGAALRNSNPEVMTTLVKAGADVNVRNVDGFTPLMLAAFYNSNPEMITTLLNLRADPKMKSNAGAMAIDYAKRNVKIRDTDAYWKLNDLSH